MDIQFLKEINCNENRTLCDSKINYFKADKLFLGDKECNGLWEIKEQIGSKSNIGSIFRTCCIDDCKYIAKEIRYDKNKPNTYQIVDQLINIYKFNWKNKFDSRSDYDKNIFNSRRNYYENNIKITNQNLIKIINDHKNILEDNIKFISPEINKKWLDLGCGKCKLFKNIENKYYPKKYLGIDNDVKILSNCLYLFDKQPEKFNIYPCDLNNNWDENNIWINFNWKINYNYIVANFSLMHFCNDLFWTQLNNVVSSGTKFIFNIVKENSYWKNNNSYTALDDVCSHKAASLSCGEIINNNVMCLYHGYQFNNNGTLVKVPGINFKHSCVHDIKKYDIIEKNGWVATSRHKS
jgi:nitrite reductase/ring-hydroxylating ferredoxin subunit